MIILDDKPTPQWLSLPGGVRILFRPISTAMMQVAQVAAGADLRKGGDNANIRAGAVLTVELARSGLVEWEGVVDKRKKPLDPTPDRLQALMEQDWRIYKAIDLQYVAPALAEHDEKNASAPSRNGTSGAKTAARRTAETAARPGAQTARTPSKPRERTGAKRPGT